MTRGRCSVCPGTGFGLGRRTAGTLPSAGHSAGRGTPRTARPGGTLVVAGFLDARPTPFPTSTPLTIFSYRSFEHTLDAVVVKRMAAFLNAGVRQGALRPAVDRVFALDDVVEAHRHLEKGLHEGKKIVVRN